MFAKAWSYIAGNFSRKEKPQPTVLLPFARPHPPPLTQLPKLAFSLSDRPREGESGAEFRVVVGGCEEFSRQLAGSQEGELGQEVIEDVRALEEQLKRLQIQERRLEETQRKSAVLDPDRTFRIQNRWQLEKQQAFEFRREYET